MDEAITTDAQTQPEHPTAYKQEQSKHLSHLWGTERTSSFYAHVLQTPLCPYSAAKTPWKELWLKDETRQITRAFKFRGNCYRVLCGRSAGQVVTAASTEGHGLGLSIAARICGIQARQDQKAVAVVSGGNIDEAAFQEALGSRDLRGPA